jgi:hypothetical protein
MQPDLRRPRRPWLDRAGTPRVSVAIVPVALLGTALVGLALSPAISSRLEARREAARVDALAASPFVGAAVCGLDPALSLRVRQLGPLLAGWETIGGCGAGGANGTGVKWMGHNTTGGLFQLMLTNNLVVIQRSPIPGQGNGGYNYILNAQLSRDLTDKWNVGLSLPYLYKYYNDPYGTGPVTNAGLGDISALLTRRLGPINATTVTGLLGLPTGTYEATYLTVPLTPDQQLGFGRLTATLQVEHTLDQTWGLLLVGGTAGYRGGRQTDKFLWLFDDKTSQHNYRAPSAALYGYAGYFLGPSLVPALGLNLTGFSKQDTRGDFGDNLSVPVATAALHASIEWSNSYVAVLFGAYLPYAIRGSTWSRSASQDAYDKQLQPWTIALGISASPF